MSVDHFLRIGTRGSPLALAQTKMTRSLLAGAHQVAEESIEIVVIRTSGDMIQDRALSEAGGKGLFTRELDIAMMEGRIDIAVHSSKDLPTVLPDGIVAAGYLPREDVRDVLISKTARSVAELRKGARIGTASLRRGAQIRRLRPDLEIALLRGNVETRLRKIEEGEFDATMLALAGLKRLGLADCAAAILDIDDFLPAVGQGAVGITAREDDRATLAALAPIPAMRSPPSARFCGCSTGRAARRWRALRVLRATGCRFAAWRCDPTDRRRAKPLAQALFSTLTRLARAQALRCGRSCRPAS